MLQIHKLTEMTNILTLKVIIVANSIYETKAH